jgi:hypothetical protein
LIRTSLKRKKRREEGREERRKEEGKSEGKHTYPPTHHMCVVICKRMRNYNKKQGKVGPFIQLYVIQAFK